MPRSRREPEPDYDFSELFEEYLGGKPPPPGEHVDISPWRCGKVRAVAVHCTEKNYDITVGDIYTTEDGREVYVENIHQARRIARQLVKKMGWIVDEDRRLVHDCD